MEYVGGQSLKQHPQGAHDGERRHVRPDSRSTRPSPTSSRSCRRSRYLHGRACSTATSSPTTSSRTATRSSSSTSAACAAPTTTTVAIYGTVGFQAPEVADVGPSVAGDIYTVGRTLAVLAMEFRGYQSTYVDVAARPSTTRRCSSSTTRSTGCSSRRAHRDPDDRFQSADELREQLLGVLREVVAVDARSPARPLARRRRCSSRRAVAAPTLDVDRAPGAQGRPGRSDGGLARRRVGRRRRRSASTALEQAPEQHRRGAARHGPCRDRGRVVPARRPQRSPSTARRRTRGSGGRCGCRASRRSRADDDAGAVASFNTVYGQVPGELAPKLALALACERTGDVDVAETLYAACAPHRRGLHRARGVRPRPPAQPGGRHRRRAGRARSRARRRAGAYVDARRRRAELLADGDRGSRRPLAPRRPASRASASIPRDRLELLVEHLSSRRSSRSSGARAGTADVTHRRRARRRARPAHSAPSSAYRELAALTDRPRRADPPGRRRQPGPAADARVTRWPTSAACRASDRDQRPVPRVVRRIDARRRAVLRRPRDRQCGRPGADERPPPSRRRRRRRPVRTHGIASGRGRAPCAACGGAVDADGWCTVCGAAGAARARPLVRAARPMGRRRVRQGHPPRAQRGRDGQRRAAPSPASFAALVVCDGVTTAATSDVASLAAARAARDVLVAGSRRPRRGVAAPRHRALDRPARIASMAANAAACRRRRAGRDRRSSRRRARSSPPSLDGPLARRRLGRRQPRLLARPTTDGVAAHRRRLVGHRPDRGRHVAATPPRPTRAPTPSPAGSGADAHDPSRRCASLAVDGAGLAAGVLRRAVELLLARRRAPPARRQPTAADAAATTRSTVAEAPRRLRQRPGRPRQHHRGPRPRSDRRRIRHRNERGVAHGRVQRRGLPERVPRPTAVPTCTPWSRSRAPAPGTPVRPAPATAAEIIIVDTSGSMDNPSTKIRAARQAARGRARRDRRRHLVRRDLRHRASARWSIPHGPAHGADDRTRRAREATASVVKRSTPTVARPSAAG